eukprot:TRINITY_DN714_c0_g1_i9.p1 TRINITY_DN714_c0_g1~~TRINITY_DN714_c0_g1_i9.p1  ORF type:complete len:139 (-),score=22.48 TRINITY_DN714_c0_g1_i9:205-621(-)
MPNGTEIGKVETHKTMNERILKISQVLPTEMYWMFYDYGNMFRWKLTIEVIKPQDSLPAPRLCAGVGLSPLENHTSLEDYVGWLSMQGEQTFDLNKINSIFLGERTIQKLNGFRRGLESDEAERSFELAQMTTLPGYA